ncbi:hypothetical protein ACQKMD_12865 [Viridibacillus sp. NPDC096237]|uniref:hypothetical protein n=1 Tax=Viridibacillus sp. NPDC096237 TaxID=3390721 RepID=UPI003CFC3CEF
MNQMSQRKEQALITKKKILKSALDYLVNMSLKMSQLIKSLKKSTSKGAFYAISTLNTVFFR